MAPAWRRFPGAVLDFLGFYRASVCAHDDPFLAGYGVLHINYRNMYFLKSQKSQKHGSNHTNHRSMPPLHENPSGLYSQLGAARLCRCHDQRKLSYVKLFIEPCGILGQTASFVLKIKAELPTETWARLQQNGVSRRTWYIQFRVMLPSKA